MPLYCLFWRIFEHAATSVCNHGNIKMSSYQGNGIIVIATNVFYHDNDRV